ncbi:L-lactate permease [Pseudoclavibacter chungangensis]|uniref:L-lactate permease n=1 Tax=Pseudoclavibacter chungangensis TaxID=587635 RepID=A0A7J5BPS5_9MICO|nr:L-lactate permease [Pseudoclavibacter chungangensis]KAB1655358.1 L-lactate permease [Pseudoclavibacter chungangensis]NYJ68308.1 lactate permease [Pseudoclavibacter chungangensis]
MPTYTPDLAPVGESLLISALLALLPLATIFVTLGVLKWKAHWAGLTSLGVAIVVAVFAYGMPVHLAGLAATQGLAFGLFPIMWIVLNAIWLYELTVHSGRFEDLRRVIDAISDDPRIQAIIIAFGFGGLLEALAGFGAPVAITGVMLMAVGFPAMRAAVIVLIANTAPVAFGAIGIPIITAGNLTGIDYHEIGAVVGHQTPLLAVFVPLFLVLLADGKRGVRDTWHIAAAVGIVFAIAQWVSATWLSVELTDVVASLAGIAAAVVMLKIAPPRGSVEARERLLALAASDEHRTDAPGGTGTAPATGAVATATRTEQLTPKRVFLALFPYLLVIAVFSLAKLWPLLRDALAATDVKIPWPWLHGNILNEAGEAVTSTVYTFTWLSSAGSLLVLCGIVVAIVDRTPLREAAAIWWRMLVKLRFSILTVGAVLALAYVMNQSGQTITIGVWIAGTGAAFAFLSPILGWLGTAVTGSDTSANALFATLQQTAAIRAGLDPTLLVAANTSGGVVGKMISPQNLTIAATAVGLVGRESELFRKVIWWSVGLLAAMCLLVGLQSSVLSWMLP